MVSTKPFDYDRRLILPKALQPGDTIAVVAPAGKVDRTSLDAGVEALRERGLKVKVGAHVLDVYGHMAGADRDRASDFMAAFIDPVIKGVFCVRGGSGSARIIRYLDMAYLASHPKIFVGYSDITALHMVFAHYAKWPTFYGPMVATETECCRNDDCFGVLWNLISNPEPAGILSLPPKHGVSSVNMQTLHSGIATGALLGGTLCVLESCIGTPYSPNTEGKILALEDVSEPPWRVDRMLTHLEQAGIFEMANGFLVGCLSDQEVNPENIEELPIVQSLMDHLGKLDKPILYGYPFGHIDQPLTLPLNCRVQLDANQHTLDILEPAVG